MRSKVLFCTIVFAFAICLMEASAFAVCKYTVTTLASNEYPVLVNEKGQVLLDFLTQQMYPGSIFLNGNWQAVPGLFPNASYVNGMNNAGDVVGTATASDGTHGFLILNGSMLDLNNFQGTQLSTARSVNNMGQVAGSSGLVGNKLPCIWDTQTYRMLPLGTLGGTEGEAVAMNDYGDVAGWCEGPLSSSTRHAFAWNSGRMTDLEAQSGWANGSEAYDIDSLGQVVGYAQSGPLSPCQPCIWRDGGRTNLGMLPGCTGGFAYGINSYGQVVGTVSSSDGSSVICAFIWENGVMYDLNNQITTPGWVLKTAVDINNSEVIVGTGTYNGSWCSYMLTPIKPVIVSIDIVPGKFPNTIDLGSKTAVTVAVLTTSAFNAKTIDPSTIRFAGASPASFVWKDVDRDKDIDLLLSFAPSTLNLTVASTQASLMGTTTDGKAIEGVDSVVVVKKPSRR